MVIPERRREHEIRILRFDWYRIYFFKHLYCIYGLLLLFFSLLSFGGRRGRDRMVVGFTTTSAIGAYRH